MPFFYPAALPLSRQILTCTAGVIRRHRPQTGSPWRTLNPGGRPPRALGRGDATAHRGEFDRPRRSTPGA